MTAPTPPRPSEHLTPPPPLELTVEPPGDSPIGRFTVVIQPFARGEAADYLAALAGRVGHPTEWEREQCRRLAARIRRWDLRRGGRPVAVSAATLARLPAWVIPQIEATLFGEPYPLAEDE